MTLSQLVTTQIFLRHTADVQSDSGCPTPCNRCDTLYYRTPRTQLGRVSRCFPFLLQLKYFSDILRTSGRTPDIRLCAMATVFLHYRTTRTQLSRAVQWFPLLLQFKYFSDILWTSGRTPDVRLCAMAAAFLYYRTTRAQLGRVFRCFPFHNISPFLLPDLVSLLPCLSN